MSARYYVFALLAFLIVVSSCNHEEKKVAQAPVVIKKADYADPFRYHKLVEVSPGEDYDVLAWGRGSATTGAFLILHSDSAGKKYTTTTGDLDGSIVDVYNSDMDLDGNPEILIQVKTADTTNSAAIYGFEFNNGKANKLEFPKLTSSQRRGYRGKDNFYVKDGKLMREFPVYDGDGIETKNAGPKRVLEYDLRNNNLTAKQLSKDSTQVNSQKAVVKEPKKRASSKKKEITASKKKTKKHTKAKKRKKHRKRRNSDDE